EDQVAAAEGFTQHFCEFHQHQIAFMRAEAGVDVAKSVEIHRHESQRAAHAIGTSDLARNEFVQCATIEQLSEWIDQRKTLQPLVQNQFADQRAACGIECQFLSEQINVKQQDERDQTKEKLRKVGGFNANHALRPYDVGENQG